MTALMTKLFVKVASLLKVLAHRTNEYDVWFVLYCICVLKF